MMSLLPNRLLKTALAFTAFAATAMLVGFVAADAIRVPQGISGETLFYSILAVFDLALMVGLAKLSRW